MVKAHRVGVRFRVVVKVRVRLGPNDNPSHHTRVKPHVVCQSSHQACLLDHPSWTHKTTNMTTPTQMIYDLTLEP